MPQSLARVLVHLIFSTKKRAPLIVPSIRSELHGYIIGTLNGIDCKAIQVGGMEDHIYMLFCLSRNLAIKEVVERVKTRSSHWIKTKGEEHRDFYWQGGYSIFSVSHSLSEAVLQYIKNQEEHHTKLTFQEEYRRFLQKHDIRYDETYMWE